MCIQLHLCRSLAEQEIKQETREIRCIYIFISVHRILKNYEKVFQNVLNPEA